MRTGDREWNPNLGDAAYLDVDAQDLEIRKAIAGGMETVIAGPEPDDAKCAVGGGLGFETLSRVSVLQGDSSAGDGGAMGVPG